MNVALTAAMLFAGLSVARAWRANANTTLHHALAWCWAAWALWVLACWQQTSELLSYLALCLTACAGVAVLGARRPGVAAWNFVVSGLLALLLLPIANGLGALKLDFASLGCLVGALLVPLFNYAPTRFGWLVPLLTMAFASELLWLTGCATSWPTHQAGRACLAAALLLANWLPDRALPSDAASSLWLSFRDRFGFLWARRIQEQFNRAAANAHSPFELRWCGLNGRSDGPAEEMLRKVLKRFDSSTSSGGLDSETA